MASILKVDTIQDQAGNNIISESANVITIGASGDTITVPAGATVSGFTSAGIDDNATSTAITIDSSGDVGINNTAPNLNPWNKAVTLSGTSNCAYELAKGSTLHGAFGLQGDNRVQLINFQSADITFNTTSSASERMRIKSDGKIGINTSAPDTTFHVGNSTDTSEYITLQSSGDKRITFKGASATRADIGVYENNHNDLVLRAGSSAGIRFATNGSNFNGAVNPIRIDTNGNLGIGVTNPSSKLQVSGTVTATSFSGDGSALTGISGGLTVADQWRYTGGTNFSTETVLSSDLERIDTSGQGTLGSGMTFSSGVFTFPSTGIYLINFICNFYVTSTSTRYAYNEIQVTTDNSSYTDVARGYQAITHVSSATYGNVSTSTLVDVTNTSNVKVKFAFASNSTVVLQGSTDKNFTHMTFLRLGDT
jgi:hypothetical protein